MEQGFELNPEQIKEITEIEYRDFLFEALDEIERNLQIEGQRPEALPYYTVQNHTGETYALIGLSTIGKTDFSEIKGIRNGVLYTCFDSNGELVGHFFANTDRDPTKRFPLIHSYPSIVVREQGRSISTVLTAVLSDYERSVSRQFGQIVRASVIDQNGDDLYIAKQRLAMMQRNTARFSQKEIELQERIYWYKLSVQRPRWEAQYKALSDAVYYYPETTTDELAAAQGKEIIITKDADGNKEKIINPIDSSITIQQVLTMVSDLRKEFVTID